MDEDQGDFSLLLLFSFLIAVLVLSWMAIGPGSQFLLEQTSVVQSWADRFAAWYQQKLEGSAKLIAPVVTIASGSYAIVKAYKFAETRLHYRLQDFLDREEKRLTGAREQLRLSIERPGPQRPFRTPIFLAPSLKNAVHELGWGSYFLPPQLPYADFQIGASIDQLEKQIQLSGDRHSYLKQQLATAHLLKGAMLTAEASTLEATGQESRGVLTSALNQFTSALAVHPDDVEALEYASHMHVRLEQDDEAEVTLDKLLKLTTELTKSIPRARALRYKGCLAARRGNNGIAAGHLQAALDALPVQVGIDRIEEAEIYETLAECQLALGRHVQASGSRATANAIYDQVRKAGAQVKKKRNGVFRTSVPAVNAQALH